MCLPRLSVCIVLFVCSCRSCCDIWHHVCVHDATLSEHVWIVFCHSRVIVEHFAGISHMCLSSVVCIVFRLCLPSCPVSKMCMWLQLVSASSVCACGVCVAALYGRLRYCVCACVCMSCVFASCCGSQLHTRSQLYVCMHAVHIAPPPRVVVSDGWFVSVAVYACQ